MEIKDKRELLHKALKDILGSDNVYYQQPENFKMKYPCFVYELDNIPVTYANNIPYQHINRYQLTFICKNPEEHESIQQKLLDTIVTIRFERLFKASKLNHYVYILLH